MAPGASLGLGAVALALLAVRELQYFWQSITGGGVATVPVVDSTTTTTVVPAAGLLERVLSGFYTLLLGALIGSGIAGWAWWRFGSRGGHAVHLAVDTSVTINNVEVQPNRRRRGRGVLEEPRTRATPVSLVQ